MVLDEPFQLGDQIPRTTRFEVRLDSILERLGPKLLQCGDGSLGKRLIGEVGQGWSPPKSQGGRQLRRSHIRRRAAGLIDQSLEPVSVDGVRLHREPVAAFQRLEQGAGPGCAAGWLEQSPPPRY